MKVVIAEKPSVGKTLAKYFGATTPRQGGGCIEGSGVAVTWCFGHLFEQADPEAYGEQFKKWSFEALPIIPTTWKLLPKSDAAEQIRILGALIKQADEVVHAGDPDREGQLLVDEVLEHFGYRGPVKRLWLAALDDESIRKALASMKDGGGFKSLKLAAESRARADWLVGMNLTRAWTVKGRASGHDGVLSVGRVQTPTLAMIVKRDLEIENFKLRDYFNVIGLFPFEAAWKPAETIDLDDEGRCVDRNSADLVAAKIKGQKAVITKSDEKKCSESAPLPHSLSSLQQASSAKYGFSAQETLDAAQALYETHKLATYPRTDCRYLPESMHLEAVSAFSSLPREYQAIALKGDPSRKSACFNDGKITAHHAIIPTKQGGEITRLSDTERKIYDLIVRAYLSQFYPPHIYQQTSVELECTAERFAVSGRITLDPGWKTVYGTEIDDREGEGSDKPLRHPPSVREGQQFTCSDARVEVKKTSPPKRYTDGTLIAAMTNVYKLVEDPEIRKRLKETAGIGTEATRAGIIETLIKRSFIQKKAKALISTESARKLIAALGDSMVTSPGMTGLFEQHLDSISNGSLDPEKFLEVQSAYIVKEIDKLRNSTAIPSMSSTMSGPKCPKCETGVMIRRARKGGGHFWSCSTYPDCNHSANDEKGKLVEKAPAASTGPQCPECKTGFMVRRAKKVGGYFWGCSGYPICKSAADDKNGHPSFGRS